MVASRAERWCDLIRRDVALLQLTLPRRRSCTQFWQLRLVYSTTDLAIGPLCFVCLGVDMTSRACPETWC